MKKRVLGLLLALCMVVCLLPMTAFAEVTQASIAFAVADYSIKGATVTKGGEAKYFYTVDGYVASKKGTTDASESDYNIKLSRRFENVPDGVFL